MATPVPHRMHEKQRNRLIAYVKKYPILYRPLDATKSTETRDLRHKLWNDIGNQLQLRGKECEKKFKTLKRNYFGRTNVSVKLMELLDFLDDDTGGSEVENELNSETTQKPPAKCLNHQPNADKYDSSSPEVDLISVHSDDILDENWQLDTSVKSAESTALENGSDAEFMSRKREHSEEEKEEDEEDDDENDGLDSFFASMEKTTRKLTPDLQLKVKRMVSDIVFDAEERWLRDQNIIIDN